VLLGARADVVKYLARRECRLSSYNACRLSATRASQQRACSGMYSHLVRYFAASASRYHLWVSASSPSSESPLPRDPRNVGADRHDPRVILTKLSNSPATLAEFGFRRRTDDSTDSCPRRTSFARHSSRATQPRTGFRDFGTFAWN